MIMTRYHAGMVTSNSIHCACPTTFMILKELSSANLIYDCSECTTTFASMLQFVKNSIESFSACYPTVTQ